MILAICGAGVCRSVTSERTVLKEPTVRWIAAFRTFVCAYCGMHLLSTWLSSHGVLGTSDASAKTVTRYRWAVRNEIFRFIHRECRTSQQARHFKIIPMISSQRRRFAAAWHSLEHSCRKLFTSNHSRSISLAGNIRPTFRGDVGLKFFYKLFGKLLNVDSY